MEKKCNIDHQNISDCFECFLAHEQLNKKYNAEIGLWDDMIDKKRETYNSWNQKVNDLKKEYNLMMKTSLQSIKELNILLSKVHIKK